MFASTMNKGFDLKFENGNGISVQFGPGSYVGSDVRGKGGYPHREHIWRSQLAEVMICDINGNTITGSILEQLGFKSHCDTNGDVAGWLTTNQVAQIITCVAGIKVPQEA